MKKIINGKLYNTETAKKIAEYSNGYGCADFYYVCETLYQKKTGEYFLYGVGGALSMYRESAGNNYVGGEEIIPYTEEEAQQWAVENLEADEYMELFGEVEE